LKKVKAAGPAVVRQAVTRGGAGLLFKLGITAVQPGGTQKENSGGEPALKPNPNRRTNPRMCAPKGRIGDQRGGLGGDEGGFWKKRGSEPTPPS